jgi:hypothetical protein
MSAYSFVGIRRVNVAVTSCSTVISRYLITLKKWETFEYEKGSIRLHSLESSIWKSLQNLPKINCMMMMTRGTNLMQQLWFIINISKCFGYLYAHLQGGSLGPQPQHIVLNTIQPVLLKMGIWMPETCRDIYDNKSQFLHQVGNSRNFLIWRTVTQISNLHDDDFDIFKRLSFLFLMFKLYLKIN